MPLISVCRLFIVIHIDCYWPFAEGFQHKLSEFSWEPSSEIGRLELGYIDIIDRSCPHNSFQLKQCTCVCRAQFNVYAVPVYFCRCSYIHNFKSKEVKLSKPLSQVKLCKLLLNLMMKNIILLIIFLMNTKL